MRARRIPGAADLAYQLSWLHHVALANENSFKMCHPEIIIGVQARLNDNLIAVIAALCSGAKATRWTAAVNCNYFTRQWCIKRTIANRYQPVAPINSIVITTGMAGFTIGITITTPTGRLGRSAGSKRPK